MADGAYPVTLNISTVFRHVYVIMSYFFFQLLIINKTIVELSTDKLLILYKLKYKKKIVMVS